MCPSLCTSIYPSLVPTFSKTILPVDVCVSSNCTKKERQRERGRGKERDANRAARTGGHLSSRLEKKNDGLAWRSNQQRGVYAHQCQCTARNATLNTHKQTDKPLYLERIKHQTYVRIKHARAVKTSKLPGHMLARNVLAKNKKTHREKNPVETMNEFLGKIWLHQLEFWILIASI